MSEFENIQLSRGVNLTHPRGGPDSHLGRLETNRAPGNIYVETPRRGVSTETGI